MASPPDRRTLVTALEASWRRATSANPDEWSTDNPALGQCEVTSLIILEYLGGDLQLSEVYVDEEMTEYHHHNLFGDEAVDVTAGQFTGAETFVPIRRLDQDFIRENFTRIRADVLDRYEVLTDTVTARVGPPAEPLRT